MFLDRNGNEIDAAYIPDGQAPFECYRVRVIRDEFNLQGVRVKRSVVGEEDFPEVPTAEQKAYCIAKYQGAFAVLELVTALGYVPFSEVE